jgi:hypothetical protein
MMVHMVVHLLCQQAMLLTVLLGVSREQQQVVAGYLLQQELVVCDAQLAVVESVLVGWLAIALLRYLLMLPFSSLPFKITLSQFPTVNVLLFSY